MNIEDSINKIKEVIYMSDGGKVDYIDINHFDLGGEVSVDIFIQAIETLLTAYEYEKETSHYNQSQLDIANAKLVEEKEKNKEYNMGIKNLISQIESAIDFMKTDKSKIKVDMYKQKEEDLKLEIVHLKKLLKEE